MLHRSPSVIHPNTFSLLERIQSDDRLNEFFLVGGTALALQIGHRLSIDLDFFRRTSFQTTKLIDYLVQTYSFQLSSVSENTVLGFMQGVKVDFITHAYPLVDPLLDIDDIRMASALDIGAMKLNAISISGQRYKDFIDIFYLLELYSLADMMAAYEEKYYYSNAIIPLKAVGYYDDLDLSIDPPVLQKDIRFEVVTNRIDKAIKNPKKVFLPLV